MGRPPALSRSVWMTIEPLRRYELIALAESQLAFDQEAIDLDPPMNKQIMYYLLFGVHAMYWFLWNVQRYDTAHDYPADFDRLAGATCEPSQQTVDY